jgi:hypothetical protein
MKTMMNGILSCWSRSREICGIQVQKHDGFVVGFFFFGERKDLLFLYSFFFPTTPTENTCTGGDALS